MKFNSCAFAAGYRPLSELVKKHKCPLKVFLLNEDSIYEITGNDNAGFYCKKEGSISKYWVHPDTPSALWSQLVAHCTCDFYSVVLVTGCQCGGN